MCTLHPAAAGGLTAAYVQLAASGELARRAQQAHTLLSPCRVCPHDCGADRLHGETGRCRTGKQAIIHSAHPHRGEEAAISGHAGSGTVFFASCNLACAYCQNAELSMDCLGFETSAEALAEMMLRLQDDGCHNINLVTPTHVMPQILEALVLAAPWGLHLPLVWNTGGYERLETLRLLDGIVDIYLPDMKYAHGPVAERYSLASDYPEHCRAAVKEMHRQVGRLVCDGQGVARRGLIIRHLVLPNGLAGSRDTLAWIAAELGTDTVVNILDQYRPAARAWELPDLDREITSAEFHEVLAIARDLGLRPLGA